MVFGELLSRLLKIGSQQSKRLAADHVVGPEDRADLAVGVVGQDQPTAEPSGCQTSGETASKAAMPPRRSCGKCLSDG